MHLPNFSTFLSLLPFLLALLLSHSSADMLTRYECYCDSTSDDYWHGMKLEHGVYSWEYIHEPTNQTYWTDLRCDFTMESLYERNRGGIKECGWLHGYWMEYEPCLQLSGWPTPGDLYPAVPGLKTCFSRWGGILPFVHTGPWGDGDTPAPEDTYLPYHGTNGTTWHQMIEMDTRYDDGTICSTLCRKRYMNAGNLCGGGAPAWLIPGQCKYTKYYNIPDAPTPIEDVTHQRAKPIVPKLPLKPGEAPAPRVAIPVGPERRKRSDEKKGGVAMPMWYTVEKRQEEEPKAPKEKAAASGQQ